MLAQIHIKNLATIAELQLDFLTGTTVITGETGAGKSILIDAIELALGGRSTVDVIRKDHDKAEVSVCFDITKIPEAKQWLTEFNLDNDNDCIIRRIITKDGKSRCFINNTPITLKPLQEFSELLIDIHGQHEHQSLLKPDFQRVLLDRYATHDALTAEVAECAKAIHTIKTEIAEFKKRSAEHHARADFLKFQLQELTELSPLPDEFIALDQEHKQLAHAGELTENLTYAINTLSENEEYNTLNTLQQTIRALEIVQKIDDKISAWVETCNNIAIQVTDVTSDIQRYLNSIELDPKRLQIVEERISKMFHLAKKYQTAPEELYQLQQTLQQEYMMLEHSDEHLATLLQKQQQLEQAYLTVTKKLTTSRTKAAKKLATEITQTIHDLALPHGEFTVSLEQENAITFSPFGLEKIVFLIKTNLGLDAQPLAKIASGGELSRISLAIHLATAQQHTIPTLIFDEVDVGIGGATAEIVGKLLRDLGKTHQVFCITHQPQVAAMGHHHLHVAKKSAKNMTFSEMKLLSAEEKIHEIARMLGGVKLTETTLLHAKELIDCVT